MGNQNSTEWENSGNSLKIKEFLENEDFNGKRLLKAEEMPSIDRAAKFVRNSLPKSNSITSSSFNSTKKDKTGGAFDISNKVDLTPESPTKQKESKKSSIFGSPQDVQDKQPNPKTKKLFGGDGFVKSIPKVSVSKPIVQKGFKVANPEKVQAKLKATYKSVLDSEPKQTVKSTPYKFVDTDKKTPNQVNVGSFNFDSPITSKTNTSSQSASKPEPQSWCSFTPRQANTLSSSAPQTSTSYYPQATMNLQSVKKSPFANTAESPKFKVVEPKRSVFEALPANEVKVQSVKKSPFLNPGKPSESSNSNAVEPKRSVFDALPSDSVKFQSVKKSPFLSPGKLSESPTKKAAKPKRSIFESAAMQPKSSPSSTTNIPGREVFEDFPEDAIKLQPIEKSPLNSGKSSGSPTTNEKRPVTPSATSGQPQASTTANRKRPPSSPEKVGKTKQVKTEFYNAKFQSVPQPQNEQLINESTKTYNTNPTEDNVKRRNEEVASPALLRAIENHRVIRFNGVEYFRGVNLHPKDVDEVVGVSKDPFGSGENVVYLRVGDRFRFVSNGIARRDLGDKLIEYYERNLEFV